MDDNLLSIAIIGGGFSGVAAAVSLLRVSQNRNLRIYLIEPNFKLGRGIAYGTECEAHLLNAPNIKMGALASQPNHFANYLGTQNLPFPENSFAPRKVYSEYLASLLANEQKCAPHAYFEHIIDTVISLKETTSKTNKTQANLKLTLSSGKTITTQKAVLALGFELPHNPPATDPSFFQHGNYFRDPWAADVFNKLHGNESIMLIGTGLTMIDQLLELYERKHRGPILAISRRGLLPQAHSKIHGSEKNPPAMPPLNTLATFKSIRAAAKNANDWRMIIDNLRSISNEWWHNLPINEQKRFLRHVQPYWDIHRHRMAPEIYTVVQSMLADKQLTIYKGRILDCEEIATYPSPRIKVTVRKRGTSESHAIIVDRLINCTGATSDLRYTERPLLKQLLKDGLISPGKLSSGLKVTDNFAVIDSNGQISNKLFALGPLLRPNIFESVAIPELRQQAAVIANGLLDG